MGALNQTALREEILAVQRMATDPTCHVWLSASAGTGKTKVLTDRLVNLLLDGVNPRKILCLTFTQAAASEMMQRLLERLGHWASCSEIDLRRDLHLLKGHLPIPELEKQARSLFAEVLELPGGFRIQTIHGFCQSLLSAFPLEAGLPLDFSLLIDRDREEQEATAQEMVFQAAEQSPPLEEALTLLAENFHAYTFKELCHKILKERIKMEGVLGNGLAAAQKNTLKALELTEEERDASPQQFLESLWNDEAPFREGLKKTARALLKGSVTDINRGKEILDWCENEKTLEAFERYSGCFLTAEGEIRQKLITRGILSLFPGAEAFLLEEAKRVQSTKDHLNRLKIAEISLALLRVTQALFISYETVKQQQNALDYDDLILKAHALLCQADFGPWILYKLDGGIDHLLVDEAQDTNKIQWDIIKTLTEEFFAGEGAQRQHRTLFVVGDGKQSIYSFQGTDPSVYQELAPYFSKKLEDRQESWRHLHMNLSFRSVAPILNFVDTLFAPKERHAALMHPHDTPLSHVCFREGHGGRVEVWPLLTSEGSSEETDVKPRVKVLLAQRVADHIDALLRQAPFLPCRGRPLEASDILVLVRTRTEFVSSLIQALKGKGIPVGGLDRLNLLEELPIQDLMALSEFLLLPENDFALACALKSPLLGLKEEDLMTLATTRGDKSLWEALKDRHASYPETVELLTDLLKQADFISPFALYSEMLFTHKGLQKILKRFGPEALDPLEEFLSLAYGYHGHSPGSLQGFLQWLQKGTLEIKRDFSQSESGKVRIMTVHGSKGLQAPVVILADMLSRPVLKEPFLWTGSPQNPWGCLWFPPKSQDTKMTKALKEEAKTRQSHEYERLLYVALTRAEDHLYLCGAQDHPEIPAGSWHHLIQLAQSQRGEKVSFSWGEGWRLEEHQKIPFEALKKEPLKESPAPLSLPPAWIFEPLLEASENPSKTPVTKEVSLSSESAVSLALARGSLFHRLLEDLPLKTPEEQQQRILSERKEWVYAHEVFEEAVQRVQDILSDPSFAKLFHPLSRAEVPIIGFYEGQLYTARLDRLVEFEEEVWIIDYKTDPCPPPSPEGLSSRYKQQLKIYGSLVQHLYPRHFLKTFILWTETKCFMEVTRELL